MVSIDSLFSDSLPLSLLVSVCPSIDLPSPVQQFLSEASRIAFTAFAFVYTHEREREGFLGRERLAYGLTWGTWDRTYRILPFCMMGKGSLLFGPEGPHLRLGIRRPSRTGKEYKKQRRTWWITLDFNGLSTFDTISGQRSSMLGVT